MTSNARSCFIEYPTMMIACVATAALDIRANPPTGVDASLVQFDIAGIARLADLALTEAGDPVDLPGGVSVYYQLGADTSTDHGLGLEGEFIEAAELLGGTYTGS